MKRILFALAILICGAYSSAFAVDGFCTVSGTTNWNITGGEGGPTTTVTTASAFQNAIKASGPQVVIVQGDLGSVGDTTTITSSKTIIGACSGGTIHGLISVDKGSSNVIISNLTMVGGPITSDDCLDVINGGHHVFVTHCDFSEAHDECFSITKTGDYVTVSWCKFHFAAAGSHSFGDLVGSSDSITQDARALHITWHHNWYSTNVTERMPRVRFGQNHVYNNYYGCPGNLYCVGVGTNCHIRLENSYFDGVNNPWKDYSDGVRYEIGYTNNVFVNGATQPTWAVNSNATIYTPPYPYTLDPAVNVKDLVTRGAGVNTCGPLALFDGGPVTGAAPLTVTFHDYSTGDITNRLLDFGDTGTTNITTINAVNHVYSAGTFTVSLTVSGSSGSNTFTRTNFIVATGGGGTPPSITQQPQPTNVCAGATAKFSVTASGTDPLSYQWQTNSVNLSNGGDFSGVTSNVVTVSPVSASDAANYRCIVANASGSATSSVAALTVNVKSADPNSATAAATTICNGQSTTLTLNGGGGGTGETIHWYSGSCGGTSVGTGNGLSVSPTTTTTYYGRYEDGAPCSYNSACASVTITVLTDSFGCWQLQYFGAGYATNPAAAATADPDGDGMSNTNEFLAGTDPTSAASVFRITSVATDSSNNVLITWSTAGVRTNVVQATAGDAYGGYSTNGFQDISGATVIINVSGDTVTNYTDMQGATNVPTRYYRIRLAP